MSRQRLYRLHPGFGEHWPPPVQRSSSLFHQSFLTHHRLALCAGRKMVRWQVFLKILNESLSVKYCHCDLNLAAALFALVYLLFIDFKCLFDIGDLWWADWQGLDFTGSESTEVTNRFDVSSSNKLPKTTRPIVGINNRCGLKFRFFIDLKDPQIIWPNTKHSP